MCSQYEIHNSTLLQVLSMQVKCNFFCFAVYTCYLQGELCCSHGPSTTLKLERWQGRKINTIIYIKKYLMLIVGVISISVFLLFANNLENKILPSNNNNSIDFHILTLLFQATSSDEYNVSDLYVISSVLNPLHQIQ